MNTQQRILKFITYANWLIWAATILIGSISFPVDVVMGIVAGGLIVTINFQLLSKTLKKALTPPHCASVKGVLVKYYIRFTITGIVIFILMTTRLVHPVGLIVGLSVVVASTMCATLNEVRQLIKKEAG